METKNITELARKHALIGNVGTEAAVLRFAGELLGPAAAEPVNVRLPDAKQLLLSAGADLQGKAAFVYVEYLQEAINAAIGGWFLWRGGECPVESSARVEIKMRNGEIATYPGGAINWASTGRRDDVAAYRIAGTIAEAEQQQAVDERELDQLRADLIDARSGWESAAEACRELDADLRVMREQRDELLAAIEALAYHSSDGRYYCNIRGDSDITSVVSEAIAKAKGGA